VTTSTAVEDDATPIAAPLPPPPAPAGPQQTEPVERVPGPPPADRPVVSATRRPRRRPSGLVGLGLGVAAVGLLEAGLLRSAGHTAAFWHTVPLWSAFATVAALVGVLASVANGARAGSDRSWRISAAGLCGLAVFWVLVVLPVGSTDRGFVLTAALGCLGVSLWLAPGRKA
jgi:ferric-dicitrate binding protein FerR (iron transport regulator)